MCGLNAHIFAPHHRPSSSLYPSIFIFCRATPHHHSTHPSCFMHSHPHHRSTYFMQSHPSSSLYPSIMFYAQPPSSPLYKFYAEPPLIIALPIHLVALECQQGLPRSRASTHRVGGLLLLVCSLNFCSPCTIAIVLLLTMYHIPCTCAMYLCHCTLAHHVPCTMYHCHVPVPLYSCSPCTITMHFILAHHVRADYLWKEKVEEEEGEEEEEYVHTKPLLHTHTHTHTHTNTNTHTPVTLWRRQQRLLGTELGICRSTGLLLLLLLLLRLLCHCCRCRLCASACWVR